MKNNFSHLNAAGAARMVNVGHKPVQRRRAVAEGKLICAAGNDSRLEEKSPAERGCADGRADRRNSSGETDERIDSAVPSAAVESR